MQYDVHRDFKKEKKDDDEWNSFVLNVERTRLNHGHVLEGAWTSRDSERDQRADEEAVVNKVSQEAVSSNDDFSSESVHGSQPSEQDHEEIDDKASPAQTPVESSRAVVVFPDQLRTLPLAEEADTKQGQDEDRGDEMDKVPEPQDVDSMFHERLLVVPCDEEADGGEEKGQDRHEHGVEDSSVPSVE